MKSIRQQLQQLTLVQNTPCVSISLNTHRTHPDNAQDVILLKNLLREAEHKVIEAHGKRSTSSLLEKLSSIESEIDINHNLDSLHIYLSNDTEEMIRSPWPAHANVVLISDSFAVRPLIKAYNRSEEYLIVVLSQSGVQIYEALNDGIVFEIRNDDFPFSENRHYITHSDKRSDAKLLDNMVREFLNKVDKAVVNVHRATELPCVVICTESNFSQLMQIADMPGIYMGYANIDYNNVALHHISAQAWEVVRKIQQERRKEAIGVVKEAVAHGLVLTDLQDIYQASIDGRGDLLIIQEGFSQPVVMTGERSFRVTDTTSDPEYIEDISSDIAWEVMSKKGRVVFTSQDEIKDLGQIVLKTRW